MTSGYLELKPRDEATAREQLAAKYEAQADAILRAFQRPSITASTPGALTKALATADDLRARASRLRTANQFQTLIESAKT